MLTAVDRRRPPPLTALRRRPLIRLIPDLPPPPSHPSTRRSPPSAVALHHRPPPPSPPSNPLLTSPPSTHPHPPSNPPSIPPVLICTMTITLHDIFHIMWIPIEGNPCIWKSGLDVYHEKTSKILDVDKDVVKNGFYYAGGYHVVKLLKHIEDGKVPTAASEAQIYLFCLLGSTLFTDSSGSRAKVGIIGGLTDVWLVAEKVWGAAALAHMYRELGKASRAKGRWDGVRLGGHSGEEGQQRLYMLRAQLDSLTHTHVQWLPYASSLVSGDARWSQYFGGIHAFDFIESHDPTRVLRQYGYRQTLTVSRIPYSSATRRVDPKGYGVTYNKLEDEYTKQGQWTAMAAYSTPITVGAEDSNVSPGYMEWYLLRTHPYILLASLAAASVGVLSERPTEYIVRHFMDGVMPLFEPDSAENFQTHAPQMYEIISRLKGLWSEYMRRK
ncbi:hypothetical protein LINGRAHAP2_LOCUS14807 [Linum grandiflorum]